MLEEYLWHKEKLEGGGRRLLSCAKGDLLRRRVDSQEGFLSLSSR